MAQRCVFRAGAKARSQSPSAVLDAAERTGTMNLRTQENPRTQIEQNRICVFSAAYGRHHLCRLCTAREHLAVRNGTVLHKAYLVPVALLGNGG